MPRKRTRRAIPVELPILAVRDTVLFPHMVAPLFVARERSVKALDEAMARDRTIVVIAQRDPTIQDIGPEDLYLVGTEA
ncbi:MAG: LON peptidase substrate-binding domain-containing protein, partial [Dehalococcoidia bacterium]|nr:LON peptidase substrate-binding domain-containing protein [Dehalococcoidia bacterium]